MILQPRCQFERVRLAFLDPHRQACAAPRNAMKVSSGPAIAPWFVRSRMIASLCASSLVTTAPMTRSEWPEMNFETLCTTRSAPRSSGCCSTGVANVLSTTTRAPASWAVSGHRCDVYDRQERIRGGLEPHESGSLDHSREVLRFRSDRHRRTPGLCPACLRTSSELP